jgi:hypothetical protein
MIWPTPVLVDFLVSTQSVNCAVKNLTQDVYLPLDAAWANLVHTLKMAGIDGRATFK